MGNKVSELGTWNPNLAEFSPEVIEEEIRVWHDNYSESMRYNSMFK